MHTKAFIPVCSGEQVWPMGLLFLKTSPVKQFSYENDFSGVFASKFSSCHLCKFVVVCSLEMME